MTHLPYDPKKALFLAFPEMKRLSKQVNDVMEGAEETLSERDLPAATRAGRGTASSRQNGASTAPMITRPHLVQSSA